MNPMFQAPTVCNTGPLIGLARVNLAWLLFRLFPEVIVPEEVRDELLAKESPDRDQLIEVLRLATIHPRQNLPDRLLLTELDPGEAAVISVARQLSLSSVILDERKARRIAARVYELDVKGTAGLLVEAKKRGMIESVKPYLEGMIEGGYHLGPNLVAACLTEAKEM